MMLASRLSVEADAAALAIGVVLVPITALACCMMGTAEGGTPFLCRHQSQKPVPAMAVLAAIQIIFLFVCIDL